MANPYNELVPVNYYIRFYGCAEGLHCNRLAFDPWRLRLHVDGPEGWVTFNGQDDFLLGVLDLAQPLYLRSISPNDGWTFMEMSEFINMLNLDYLSY